MPEQYADKRPATYIVAALLTSVLAYASTQAWWLYFPPANLAHYTILGLYLGFILAPFVLLVMAYDSWKNS